MGIGNTLRCDDAAGVLVARSLIAAPVIRDLKTIRVIDAGHAPENFSADLRRFAPHILLFIDAAQLNAVPGTIRSVELDELDGMSASTHTLPLSMLAKYLTLELDCKIAFLGIQPKCNEVGEMVSEEVEAAIRNVVQELIEVLSRQPVS